MIINPLQILELLKNEGELEIWKDIFPGYKISNLGRVKRLKTYQVKQDTIFLGSKRGKYLQTMVSGKIHYIHRLIAEQFVHNPNPKLFTAIYHIDNNTKNNKATNLAWVHPNMLVSTGGRRYPELVTKDYIISNAYKAKVRRSSSSVLDLGFYNTEQDAKNAIKKYHLGKTGDKQ